MMTKLFVVATATAAVAGCLESQPSTAGAMQVIAFQAVASDGTGQYAITDVPLSDDVRLAPLGDAVWHFWDAPEINASVDEPQVATLPASYAHRYKPRYQVLGGTAVALDTESLVTMSAYYAFGNVLQTSKALVGDVVELVPEGGIHVVVNPVLHTGIVTSEPFSNAFYLGSGARTFGLVRSNEYLEGVPIAATLPVIAHEFGHHVFYSTFGIADGLCDPNAANDGYDFPGRLGLRGDVAGFNEGFADIYSYLVTQVTNPLADAFANIDIAVAAGRNPLGERALVPEAVRYQEFTIEKSSYECKSHYCIGTLWARSMMQTLRALQMDTPTGRQAFAHDLVRMLPRLPARIKKLIEDEDIEGFEQGCKTSDFTSAGLQVLASSTTQAYLTAFVQEAPALWRPELCRSFKQFFGVNFAPAKETCP